MAMAGAEVGLRAGWVRCPCWRVGSLWGRQLGGPRGWSRPRQRKGSGVVEKLVSG